MTRKVFGITTDFEYEVNKLIDLAIFKPDIEPMWAYYDPVTAAWQCVNDPRVCRVKVRIGFGVFFKTYAYFEPGNVLLISDKEHGKTIIPESERLKGIADCWLIPLQEDESIAEYQLEKGGRWLEFPRIGGNNE